jgi:hypothetical protein
MRMIATRRRFLVSAIAYSGLLSSGAGVALLRAGGAWAQSSGGRGDELTSMARLLCPHAGIADDVYAQVIDEVLSAAADDSSLMEALGDAVSALNAAQGGDWFEIETEDQIRAMKAVEDKPFFAVVQADVRDRFYNHPKVWEHISYPGSSVQLGGYVDRGFDDIDWLPKDDA